MSDFLRVKQAAKILRISPGTLRNWCNDGRIEYSLSAAGQRIFEKDYIERYYNESIGVETPTAPHKKTVFYVRSSDGNDVTMKTQTDKLTAEYGNPDNVFSDKASGLNENRRGLNSLIEFVKNNPSMIYITNKDRLTRFGYKYLENLMAAYDSHIIVLDSDETKEPHEIMMQDFLSIIASYAGKFYRLRGNEQKKKLVKKVQERLNKSE